MARRLTRVWPLVVLLVAILSSADRAAAALDRVKAYDLYVQGNDLYTAGDLPGAISVYKKALEHDETHADSLTNLGSALQDLAWQREEAGAQTESLRLLKEAVQAYRAAVAANPYHAMASYNLALLLHNDAPQEAVEHYLSAIEADPTMADAFSNLGAAYHAQQMYKQAVPHYLEAVELFTAQLETERASPDAADDALIGQYTSYLAVLHARCGEAMVRMPDSECGDAGCVADAIEHLTMSLQYDPNNELTRHSLAALREERVQASSPEYIARLFDDFAPTFDDNLTDLGYTSPQALFRELEAVLDGGKFDVVVDAGCGTGLMGKLVRGRCARLVGIDLSPKMVDRARATGAYDELHVGEIAETLRQMPGQADAVVAADVFLYAGDLSPALDACAAALRPGGVLAFTLERISPEQCDADADAQGGEQQQCAGWKLLRSGRFAHVRGYVEAAAAAAGLAPRAYSEHVPRLESGRPVPGHLFVFERPRSAETE